VGNDKICCVFTTREDKRSLPSSAGTPAPLIEPVSLEYQSEQAYWRSGPGHKITERKQINSSAPENAPKYALRDPKMKNETFLGTKHCSILASSALDLAP